MSIKVDNVFYIYDPRSINPTPALNGVSLTIKEGSFTAVLGQTGCGKSTLIQTFNALLLPSSGSIQVDDFLVTPNKRKNKRIKNLRKHLSIVFQFPEYQLFEETVEKDVMFGPKNFGQSYDEALKVAHESLLSVGLDESYFSRSPFELSGGEQRRVAIAGILALQPDILVLDEPTVGLDPKAKKDLLELLHQLNKNGHTIIVVTHDMDVVTQFATDIIIMKEGKVVFHDEREKLFDINLEELSIETTPLITLTNSLIKKGLKIDRSKIFVIDDLVKEIRRCKKDG